MRVMNDSAFDCTADYIVVGAGSAGGRDRNPMIHVPMGIRWVVGNPATDWRFRTQTQPELKGRSLNFPRGKTLGGTSAINGLAYVRGFPADYDAWAAAGCAVLFKERRAIGVEYVQGGQKHRARARRNAPTIMIAEKAADLIAKELST
jgi:hypothetical protein